MSGIETGLVVGGLQGLLVGTLLALVAKGFHDRPISSGHKSARDAFVLWWAMASALSVLWGAQLLLAGLGVTTLSLHVSAFRMEVLGGAIALWGLTYYVMYLWTGETWVRWPLGVVAAGMFISLDYLITALAPVDLEVTAWTLRPIFRRQPGEAELLLLGAFFAILLAALMAAYLVLLRFVRSAEHRFRVLSLGGGILAWVVLTLAIGALGDARYGGPANLALDMVFALFLYATQVHSERLAEWLERIEPGVVAR